MTRKVMCRKYGESLPGLESPPIPGPLGARLFDEVSAKAWQHWLELQTMLINENHLNLRDASARKYLSEQREKFLDNADWERPAGYVAKQD